MDPKLECSGLIAEKPILAAMQLRDRASEPWDSGFDSDEPGSFQPLEITDESEEEESSDDELINIEKERRPNLKRKAEEPLIEMEEEQRASVDILVQWRQNGSIRESSISDSYDRSISDGYDRSISDSYDRSSPPLYEVELTASDEDDDASVLELVIPMQSRYQRVPTSSPKKTKPKSRTLFSALFCCMRK